MTPEERDLITDLFERLRSAPPVEKDREAEAFIAQSVRQVPDAVYKLVQTTLILEQTLQQADQHVRNLESRMRELEGSQQRSTGSGSFLGGLFGGSRPQPRPAPSGSVPPIGSRAGEMDYPRGPMPQQGSPWGQPGPGGPGGPMPGPAPQGGGFLRSAAATAAGVAGGVLLADSLRNMMGGHAHAAQPGGGLFGGAAGEHARSDPQYQSAADNDPGTYDPSNDPGAAEPDMEEVEQEPEDGGDDWGRGGDDSGSMDI